MVTTMSKPSEVSSLRSPLRPRKAVAPEKRPNKESSLLAFASGAKAAVPVLLGLIPLAVVCGTTATGTGLSALEALALSVFFLSGAAQLAATQLIAAGASVTVIVLAVLIISLRLTVYSASIAPHFQRLST